MNVEWLPSLSLDTAYGPVSFSMSANGRVAKAVAKDATEWSPASGLTTSVTFAVEVDAAEVDRWFTESLTQIARARNEDLRRLWRERVLERLYGLCGSTFERPCAACGEPGPWFVCLRCSTGVAGHRFWPLRIKPEAAERIKAKMYARRNEEPLSLP
jgi:hypothetical protein